MIENVLRRSQFSVLQVSLPWNPVQVFFFKLGNFVAVLPQKWKSKSKVIPSYFPNRRF